ncbi:uncharacterized protein LOC126577772 [Anopheles aquasalis]|uniref:uncharacterized protein LOC126577772 n=1 Tax=Anopheles aquasalis TaxID=42839 RepID=UPI00215AC5D4|nr:uncharacterized protein LOC126577772 [Anopheles aquasalis]
MSLRAETYLALCLIDAIEDSNLDALRLLLEKHHANPNTIIPEKDVAPIHLVIGADHEPFAERATSLMLQFGGNANLASVEQRLTPLHVAASLGRAGIARLLLKAGGNVELLDDEDRTPIEHAIEEGHYEVLALLKNHVFEQKIERRRKKLLQEQEQQQQQQQLCPAASEMSSLLASPSMRLRKGFAEKMAPLPGKTLSHALQELDENVLTPNKIHYNFDVTSPYYVNITHRRKDRKKHNHNSVSQTLFLPDGQENSTPPAAGGQCDDDGPPPGPERTNLFELTERNLRNFTRDDDERRSDRRRSSFIECWREQIAELRGRTRISCRMDDIDRILASFTETPNQTAYLDAVDESFRTAQEVEPSNHPVATKKQEHEDQELEQDQPANVEIPMEALQKDEDRDDDDLREQEVCEVIAIVDSSHEDDVDDDKPVNDATTMPPPPTPAAQLVPQIQITTDTVATWSFPVKRNPSITSQSTVVTLPPLDYDTDALRAELTQYGEPPGPITKHTKKLYLRKLIKCRRHPERVTAAASARALGSKNYSVELMTTVRREETFSKITEDHQPLEREMASEFQSSNGARTRQFREGHQKKSFIYLLLDPRITDNLPAQQQQQPNTQHELWKCFLSAVFYVGKGKSSRPYNHLHDALKLYRPTTGTGNMARNPIEEPVEEDDGLLVDETEIVEKCQLEATTKRLTVAPTREAATIPAAEVEKSDSRKLNRILDIWAASKGVVCLHVFHNIMPAEAYTREAAIIDAIRLANLTNLKRGDYYGKCVSWPLKRRKQLGILLLWKAFLIYLAEGETQLLPGDLV